MFTFSWKRKVNRMSGKVIKAHWRKIKDGKAVIRVPQADDARRAFKAAKVRMAKAHKQAFGK